MARSRSRSLTTSVLGVLAVGSLLVLSACAPEPAPTPTATTAPETPAPEPYEGPLTFVGDELDWFLPSAEEIAATIPGAAGIGEPAPSLIQISDGFGAELDPEICVVFLSEASLGSIGARTITWTGSAGDTREGSFKVLQFADETQAQNRMDDYVEAAAACPEFILNGQASSYANTVIDEGDGVRAVAGALVLDDGGEEAFRSYHGVASVGNVLVEFWHPFEGDATMDTAAAAQLLRDRAHQASEQLVEELTANPPAEREVPEADASAPWSAWEIGFDGVGPLRLGQDIGTVAATVPGAEFVEPADGIGQTQFVSQDGSARLEVLPQEEKTAVATILAGQIGTYGMPPVDGSVLPRAGGVGVGDPVTDAITAFPQGTAVRIVAAGLYQYEVSTRDGRVLLFHTDREVSEAGAMIVGITAEDGTLRRQFHYTAAG